jgi:CheY-like chemotaxis protein
MSRESRADSVDVRLHHPLTTDILKVGTRDAPGSAGECLLGGRYPRAVDDGRIRRILVVDDEPQLRATIREALHLEGYDVVEAGNGAEALTLLASARPDAIVLDLWMPVMDGWEFRRAQLAAYPRIPVVVLSALDLSNERLDELGADALIGKPFDLEVLFGAVADVLARPS